MHKMSLKITDSGHQWVCAECGRVVSTDNGLTVINQGDLYALHSSPIFPDSDLLSMDFETDLIGPEEQAMLDQWKAEFDG